MVGFFKSAIIIIHYSLGGIAMSRVFCLLSLIILLTACSGRARTVAKPVMNRTNIEAAILRIEDLPGDPNSWADFDLDPSFLPQTSYCGFDHRDATLGHHTLIVGDGGQLVGEVITVYQDENTARDAMDIIAETSRNCKRGTIASLFQETETIQLHPLDFPQMGDDTFSAAEFSILETHIIYVRDDSVIVEIIYSALDPDIEATENIVRIALEKLR